MNLTRLKIQNFRSLYDVELELKPITILIGPNASGKSNLFKALRLIYDGVAGDIKDWQAYSAQMDDLLWYGDRNGGRPDELLFVFDFDFESFEQVQYGIKFRTKNYLETDGEWLTGQGPGQIFQKNELTAQNEIQDYLLYSARRIPALRDAWNELHAILVKKNIAGWRFFETNPKAARPPHFIPQYPDELPILEGDFSNLSAFLYALHQLHPEDFETLTQALSRSIELPKDIKIEHDGGRGGQTARYGFVEEAFGEKRLIPPESMSDGTISLLAHFALLLADRSVTLACLEEPDNGLHPRMMIYLADAMRQAISREVNDNDEAETTSPQILVTTHSPEFMDCFDLSEETDYLQVYLVERNELGQTVFSPATAAEFAPWLEKYRLGEAVRRHFI